MKKLLSLQYFGEEKCCLSMFSVNTGSNNQNTVAPVPGRADMQDTMREIWRRRQMAMIHLRTT